MTKTPQEQYQEILNGLEVTHGELIRAHKQAKVAGTWDNPATLGDFLLDLRLGVSLLYGFWNQQLQSLNTKLGVVEKERQKLFKEGIKVGSINQAKITSTESTRELQSEVEIIRNGIQEIKNEIEKYSDICSALQSRMKEFNAERMMG